jgi:hypothetical protein
MNCKKSLAGAAVWIALALLPIQFLVNSTLVNVHTTNVPTAVGQVFLQAQTLEEAGAVKSLDIDKVRRSPA